MTTKAVLNAHKLHLHALLLVLVVGGASAIDTATQVVDGVGGNDVSATPGLLAVLAIFSGLLCGFAGYRFLKPLTFAGGFVAGGYCAAYAVEQAANSDGGFVPFVSWLAFAIGGLVAGGAMLAVYGLTVLFIGAAGGFVLAYMVYTIFGTEIYATERIRVLQITAVALCVVGAVLAWSLERPMLIVTTRFVGAGLVLYGLGFFTGQFPNGCGVAKIWAASQYLSWWEAVPGAWWGYVAAFIALFAICMVVQLEKTSPRQRVDSRSRLTEDWSRLGRSVRTQYTNYALSPV